MNKIIIYFKRLFCKHEYIEKIIYLISNGKNKKIYCKKCGKVKEYIPMEKHNYFELKEHALNNNWHIE